jgi:hypothetical protein
MPYLGPTTRDAIRESLKTQYDKSSMTTQILLDGEVIGQVVTYGKKNSLRPSMSGLRATVYNGRVSVNGHTLSVEGSKTVSMLNALAGQLGRALRSDRKVGPTDSDVEASVPSAVTPTPKI